jgi:hypothetical protein
LTRLSNLRRTLSLESVELSKPALMSSTSISLTVISCQAFYLSLPTSSPTNTVEVSRIESDLPL